MGKPAARISDMHVCPMVTGVVPHVGGPILPPGAPTVLIGGLPAACMGDMVTCTGPPDTILMGCMVVTIGGKPAARLGDLTAHGGQIILGCMTVLIGESGGGGGGGGGGSAMSTSPQVQQAINSLPPQQAVQAGQVLALKEAAQEGAPLVHSPDNCPICAQKLK